MILPEDAPENFHPNNMCTIEHLHTRRNPRRRQKHPTPTTTICCRKCNLERGEKEKIRLSVSNNIHNHINILSQIPMKDYPKDYRQYFHTAIGQLKGVVRAITITMALFLCSSLFAQTPFYIMKPIFVERPVTRSVILGDTTEEFELINEDPIILQGVSLKNTWLNSKLTFALADDGLLRDNIVFSARVLYTPLHGQDWAFPIVSTAAPNNKNLFVAESGLNLGVYPYKILGSNSKIITVLHGGVGYKVVPTENPGEIATQQIKALVGIEWLIYQEGFKAPATISLTQNMWKNDKVIFGLEITGIIPVGVDMGILVEYYQPYTTTGGARAGIIINSLN